MADERWISLPDAPIKERSGGVFDSFAGFSAYPVSDLPGDPERGGNLLRDGSVQFGKVADMIDLRSFVRVNRRIRLTAGLDRRLLVWVMAQAPSPMEAEIRRHLFRRDLLRDVMAMRAALMLMLKWETFELRTDELETVMSLAFSALSAVKGLATNVLPDLASRVPATALLFQRFLPYCGVALPSVRQFALSQCIRALREKFAPCASLWIMLHPFCVPGSTNLVITMSRSGLLSERMRPMLKRLVAIDKALLAGKFVAPVGRERLPRALRRAEIRPPAAEVAASREMMRAVLKQFSWRRKIAAWGRVRRLRVCAAAILAAIACLWWAVRWVAKRR